MKTVSDPRLPFTMQIPDDCEVESETTPIGNPKITIMREGPFLNLIWGECPESLEDFVPPGYKLIERHQIRTDGSSITLLVAHSSPLSGIIETTIPGISFFWDFALFWGVVAAIVSFPLLWILKQNIAFAILIGFVVVMLSWTYIANKTDPTIKVKKVKIDPTIKYAFIFGGEEFVFTGFWRQRAEVEKCVMSIKFRSEGGSGTPCLGELLSGSLNREAFLCVEQGEFQQAVSLLEKALRLDPECANSHNELCICYDRLGKPELAEREARAAVSCAPDNPKFKNGLIGVLYRKASMSKSRQEVAKRLIEINQEIEQLIAAHPEYPPAYLSKAGALALGGAAEESWEAELEKAAKQYRLAGETGDTFAATKGRIHQIIEENKVRCREIHEIWEQLPEK